jgi:primase-polymerase (primpol)-like protein
MQSKRYKYTRHNTNSRSNQVIMMTNTKFSTQEGSNQNTRVLNAKDHTPLEAKVNHKLPLKPR